MDLKIYDDFLPEEEFKKIENNLMGHMFPWFYTYKITESDQKQKHPSFQYQFCHIFFGDHQITSNFFPLLEPVLNKLDAKALIRIKANCIPKTFEIVNHGFHIDMKNNRTAILFINSNDGYTEFKFGKTVESKRSRLIEFDSNLLHRGSTCTDQQIRVNINFNYYKN